MNACCGYFSGVQVHKHISVYTHTPVLPTQKLDAGDYIWIELHTNKCAKEETLHFYLLQQQQQQ